MQISTSDYDLTISPEDSGTLLIMGDWDSLEAFKSGVALAGVSEGRGEPTEVEVVSVPTLNDRGCYRATRGTVALFLSFEVLNYL